MENIQSDFKKYIKSEYNDYAANNIFSVDIYGKLFENRVIFITGELTDHSTNMIKAQLLYLEQIDNKKDIKLYASSGGGTVYSSLGIVDTINLISCDVETVNIGICASMTTIILASGTKGKRKSLKSSRTMIHQPSSFGEGTSSDLEINAIEVKKMKYELYKILSETTGHDIKKIERDSDRDFWMSAVEAKKYGIIDEIITKKPN